MVWHVNGTPTNIMRCADSSTLSSQEYPKRWALRRGGLHPPMCNAECVVWPSARRLACLSASLDHKFAPAVGLPTHPPPLPPFAKLKSMNFSQWFCFASFFPMSDIEDDISSRMFSGNLYLQDNLGSETGHYEGISSLSLLNTSAI